jgi:aspartate/methionine/tyrosine aminotransferase
MFTFENWAGRLMELRMATPIQMSEVQEFLATPQRVLESDDAIGAWLLDAAHVAVVPGGAFGASGHLRLSYAVSLEQIDEALRRIAKAVGSLH